MSPQGELDPGGFQSLIQKGQHLLKLMRMSQAEFRAGPGLSKSRFVSLEDPKLHGWTQVIGSWKPEGMFQAVYDDLGASSARENNKGIAFTHGPSAANFEIAVNVDAGIIQAISSMSPTHQIGPREVPIPALHFWSDFAYLAWLTVAQSVTHSKPVDGPSFVIRENVQNPLTHNVLIMFPRRAGYQDLQPAWPGYEFSLEGEGSEVLAILATPNGAGAAWFLIDHKEEFGVRVLSKVKVFVERHTYNLLFYTRKLVE